MLDSSWSYSYPDALRVGQAIQDLGYFWYEDPLPDHDIHGYQRLARHLTIPLLATEITPGGLTALPPWITAGATDFLRGNVVIKGFEGFASSMDGKFLYGLLEGPLWDAEKKDWERVDGEEELPRDSRIRRRRGTVARALLAVVFEQNGNAIGDFDMIDASNGLMIERGTTAKAPRTRRARKAPAAKTASRTSPSSSASTRSDSATPTSASRSARSPIST